MANERDEKFWINACLHLIFCNKASRPNGCEKCISIEQAVNEDKPEVLEDFTYTRGPR
jgi:hypothetical protein